MKFMGLLASIASIIFFGLEAGPNDDLVKAIRTGNVAKVQIAIKGGADINFKDSMGRTPLMKATGMRGTESLLGETLYMSDVARLLIAHGAQVNAQDSNGNTALMMAAQEGNEKTVEALLNAGANTDITNNAGKKAIDLTSNEKIKQLIKQYAQLRADAERKKVEKEEESRKQEELQRAKEAKQKEEERIKQEVLQRIKEPKRKEEERLKLEEEKAKKATPEEPKSLPLAPAQTLEVKPSKLERALEKDDLGRFSVLLIEDNEDILIDPLTGKSKILELARQKYQKDPSQLKKVENIFNKKSRIDLDELKLAAQRKSKLALTLSLKRMNVNTVDGNGYSLLMLIIKNNRKGLIDEINFLIKNGANVNIKSEDNETAISLAKKLEDPERSQVIKILRDAGAK